MTNQHYERFIGDPKHQIIAAGPLLVIDCGLLGLMYRRVVVRFSILDKADYALCIETIDAKGEHEAFDNVSIRMSETFPAKGFLDLIRSELGVFPLYHS